MEILIDTHILIWYIEGDESLPVATLELIQNLRNDIYISVVSFYEIAIKLNIGKLEMGKTIEQLYKQTTDAYITILPIAKEHLTQYQKLPLYQTHKDPFDRLIIATAITHNFSLLSADNNFELYSELVELIA